MRLHILHLRAVCAVEDMKQVAPHRKRVRHTDGPLQDGWDDPLLMGMWMNRWPSGIVAKLPDRRMAFY